ncbi:hypothetical protein OKW98_15405 [Pseudomonas sp. KU26590]|uniref:DUF6875 domain-containing protein n=1 Tax=Pseudomonas sp. KU26590 TaxID=2991051 RepID=UPI00223D77CC|nr:hypothetical protein [Pseudomonas sp. KU26590]UZJ58007.1 hypothetical protein OKW98_15405 [Pseudomonas sp. KU26590]
MNAWTACTFDSAHVPDWAADNYQKILPYVTSFLTSKHPYRNGVMCPFVPKAVKEGLIYYTYYQNDTAAGSGHVLRNLLLDFKRLIGESNGAIVVILKENFSIEELLKIHIANKKRCIKSSVMLGALYKTNSATSLHSTEYYPLRTPTPTLVLRNLTSSDLVFLNPTHYSRFERIAFLSAFIRKFSGAAEKSSFTRQQVSTANELRAKYLKELIGSWAKIITALILTISTLLLLRG